MNAIRWLSPRAVASQVPTARFDACADQTLVDFNDDHAAESTIDLDDGFVQTIDLEAPDLEAPESRMSRYEIEGLLGQGAFGDVFAARDTKLDRCVALKLLKREHAGDFELRQRLVQEAHAAASIAHPGIVTVFDGGVHERTNTIYIAMELLSGESLQARIARCGDMPSARVREIGRQVASALEAAHRSGVIHRDLKPENIFLVPDRAMVDGERVKVLDFGFAKPTRTATITTAVTAVFGTPYYMAPEQLASARDADHRSDIYALGCTLFELATGRPPFEGSLREVAMQHLSSPPPSLRAVVPDACPELDELVQRMLAKDPAARPPTMHYVEQALGGKLNAEPIEASVSDPDAVDMAFDQDVRFAAHDKRGHRLRRFITATIGLALCLTCAPSGTDREPPLASAAPAPRPADPEASPSRVARCTAGAICDEHDRVLEESTP